MEGFGVVHALLSVLPVESVVTTNYDTCHEHANQSADRLISVLPYEFDKRGEKTLLKLHGCREHPEDIVLTRVTDCHVVRQS